MHCRVLIMICDCVCKRDNVQNSCDCVNLGEAVVAQSAWAGRWRVLISRPGTDKNTESMAKV